MAWSIWPSGDVYQIGGTNVLSCTALGTNVMNSSLTSGGSLASGSIANGFGTIATFNTITGSTLIVTTGSTTNAGSWDEPNCCERKLGQDRKHYRIRCSRQCGDFRYIDVQCGRQHVHPLDSTKPTANNLIYNPFPIATQDIHTWQTSAAGACTCRKLVMEFAPSYCDSQLVLYFKCYKCFK